MLKYGSATITASPEQLRFVTEDELLAWHALDEQFKQHIPSTWSTRMLDIRPGSDNTGDAEFFTPFYKGPKTAPPSGRGARLVQMPLLNHHNYHHHHNQQSTLTRPGLPNTPWQFILRVELSSQRPSAPRSHHLKTEIVPHPPGCAPSADASSTEN